MRVTSSPVSPFPSYLFPCSITSYWHSVTSHIHVLETPACVYMFSPAPLCRHNQTLESRYSITKTGTYWCYSSSSSRAGQPRQSSCIRWLLVTGSQILSFFPSVCLPILIAKPHSLQVWGYRSCDGWSSSWGPEWARNQQGGRCGEGKHTLKTTPT